MRNDRKLSAVMAAWDADLPPTEKLVLVCLVQHVNPKTETAWPSVARLCRLTGLCRRSVQRAMGRLETAGVIGRVNRTGMVSEYRVTLIVTGAEGENDPRHRDAPPASPVRPPRVTETPPPRHRDAQTCIEREREHEKNTQEGECVNALRDQIQKTRDELQAAYPKRFPIMRWDWKVIDARLAEGATPDELKAAARRYATYCDATLIAGTRFVMFPEKFFTAGSDAPWRQPFMVAGGRGATPGTLSPEQRAELSSDREANRLGIPLRQPAETLEKYQRRVRDAFIQDSLDKMAKQHQGRK